MKTIQDCFGHAVRLTDERMAHILEHPEMSGMGAEIERVLTEPQTVRRSLVLRILRPDNCGWQMAVRCRKMLGRRCLRRHRISHRQTQDRRHIMADKLKVWFDAEADFLEVRFSDAAGYEKETNNDAVMERVDAQGHIVGFSIMGVSQFRKEKPLEAELAPA
jgi:uncharacterized protein YuzE